jgi:glucose-1-phosphate adenylyltransferase
VTGSLIANGCRIEGTVENSVIFRGVHVEKGAVVKDSIIMQNGYVGQGSFVQYSIMDKDVRVEAGRDIRGAGASPFMAAKRKII